MILSFTGNRENAPTHELSSLYLCNNCRINFYIPVIYHFDSYQLLCHFPFTFAKLTFIWTLQYAQNAIWHINSNFRMINHDYTHKISISKCFNLWIIFTYRNLHYTLNFIRIIKNTLQKLEYLLWHRKKLRKNTSRRKQFTLSQTPSMIYLKWLGHTGIGKRKVHPGPWPQLVAYA